MPDLALSRRVFSRRVLLVAGSAFPLMAFARDTPMREALDLRQAAATNDKPLVLLISLKGCPFCEFVRRSYLLPMNREGQINAWQVSIDRAEPLLDFDGKRVTAREWAAKQGPIQTPTVLFLQANGKPSAEPLVGVVSSDFYGAMLNERLKL